MMKLPNQNKSIRIKKINNSPVKRKIRQKLKIAKDSKRKRKSLKIYDSKINLRSIDKLSTCSIF